MMCKNLGSLKVEGYHLRILINQTLCKNIILYYELQLNIKLYVNYSLLSI